jgi:hypothetical protein
MNEDESNVCQIDIDIGKSWYQMNESYFIATDLILLRELSEIELNLRNYLEPWWEQMKTKNLHLTRDLKKLCMKMGYNEQGLPELRRKLKRVVLGINDKCGRDYQLSFNKQSVVLSSEMGAYFRENKII